MFTTILIILSILITYIGFAGLYCYFNKDRIGGKEVTYEDWGPVEYIVESEDIVMESMVWPFKFIILIVIIPIFLPWLLLTAFIDIITDKKKIENIKSE